MSCSVMYQPYAMSYSSSCDRTTADNLKKSFKFPHAPSPPESSHSNASSAYSSPGSTGGSGLHHTSSVLGSLSLLPPHLHSPSSVSSLSNNNNGASQRRPLTPSCASGSGSAGAQATITSGSHLHHQSHHSSSSHHSYTGSSSHHHHPHHSSSSTSSYHHSHHTNRGGSSSSSSGSSTSSAYPSLAQRASTPSATATSSRDLTTSQQQQQQQQHAPSSASSSSHHATGIRASAAVGASSTPSATVTSADQSDDESPVGPSTNSEGAGNERDENEGATNRAQYLSANCILYVNYDGNAARVVEEHFNRALSYPGEKSSSKPLPMSTRNFPASFWNSNYQHAKASTAAALGYGATAADFYGMDYSASISGFAHHHPQADPWLYSLGHHHHPHHQSYHHRPTDITYPPMTSTSRFNAAQYGSFLFPSTSAATAAASRFTGIPTPGQCSVKGTDTAHHWPTAGGRYDGWSDLHLAADYSAAAAAHYSNMTAAAGKGLDFETHYLQSS